MKITGIYKIINMATGKSYIGKSVDIERRWMEHKAPSARRLSIDLDIKELGSETFKIIVLKKCSEDELKELEEKYIKELKPEYNVKTIDNSCSEKNKEKIRVATKIWWKNLPDDTKKKIIKNNLTHKGWKNHTVPNYVRKKISKTLMGKYTKRVRIPELNKSFNSINECAKFLKTDSTYVSKCLHGRYEKVKGYKVVYERIKDKSK